MTADFHSPELKRSSGAAPLARTEEERRVAAHHLAHDARNWLTVLQVYCDLLRSSGTVSGDGRSWMEELSSAVERGQGLVMSLLDTAQTSTPQKSPAGQAVATAKTLDLAAVTQKRLPLFREMAGSAIRLESRITAHAKTMAIGEADFDRILLNLVRNSIDAMPEGGVLKIELELGDASRARPLLVRVSDTGKGIRADLLGHIFESGFSTKPAGSDTKSGRGYGLAIVRGLVRAAGGTVRVRSIVGQGTCFTLELPARYQPTVAKPRVSQPESAPAAKHSQRTNGRTRQHNNFGAVRKGTRVPC